MIGSGRTKITTNYESVDDTNIIDILSTAYPIHQVNITEINYLENYYKGIQPILKREKKIRPEHNAKIVENIAYSIVQFKTGYLLDKPIQYVARKEEVDDASLISFNDFLNIESKESKDKAVANKKEICGQSYRLCLPNEKYGENAYDESPFNIYTIDPKKAFIVYSNDIGNKAMVGCIIKTIKHNDGKEDVILQAYTENKYYEFIYGTTALTKNETHTKGAIPLIEYPNNDERIGSFELVLPLLDAINLIESDRVNAVSQFVQSLMVFKNIEISEEMLKNLQQMGAINISDNGEVEAKIEFLQQELNQEQVQKLKDNFTDIVYKIVGMPLGKSGTIGNSQGAVIMRDGWSETEAKTLDDELMFKASEKQFLKLALSYTRTLTKNKVVLNLADIDIKFTRRNYENLYQKAQVLTMMLSQPKIAPRLAFVVCGLFADPEESYKESEEYYNTHQPKQVEEVKDPNATTD